MAVFSIRNSLIVQLLPVSRWFQIWHANGAKALKKAGRAGRKLRLQLQGLEQLRGELKEGPEGWGYGAGLWTAWRVTELIQRQTSKTFHPGHVWRILRSLGWSCQRSVGGTMQRRKRSRWPAIRKKPSSNGARSFLQARAA